MTTAGAETDLTILDLLRKVRLAKPADLRFWLGRNPSASLKRLEEADAIERVGPADPAQHYRAVSFAEQAA